MSLPPCTVVSWAITGRSAPGFLGAGFSKSLGGPLLPELLSLNALAEVRSRYSNYPHLEGHQLVYWLYHYGSQFGEGVPEGRRMTGVRAWRDAEEFLERLGVAATSHSAANKLDRLLADLRGQYGAAAALPEISSSKQLDVLGRRLVGAACCAFLDEIDETGVRELERWRPYREWFARLGPTDYLISFNYDRVIERLEAACGGRLRVVTESATASLALQGRSCVQLLKLHGSVDWTRGKGGVTPHTDHKWILKLRGR